MKNLHLIVRDQFPEFVREDYPVFVAFVQAYYKWIDQRSAGSLEDIKNLDKTPEEFVQYFRSELDGFGLFNQTQQFNRLYLQKIKQIYSAKGSEQALVNILRLTRQTDATIKYPNENILRASDGKWLQTNFITVETTFGTIPNKINQFYINFQYANIAVDVEKFVVINPTKIRLYYKIRSDIVISNQQLINVNDNTGAVIYSGRVVNSPSSLTVINGGKSWRVGQVITVPGSVENTIARITQVDAEGAVLRVEIIEHGYEHTQNQLITASPYPNKPLSSTYNITSEIVSVDPVTYQHTLDVFDYTDGIEEYVSGVMSGIAYYSYFLEDYAEPYYNGERVLEVSSVFILPESNQESDITMEEWLASRATFRYIFEPVVTLRGRWLDESGLISNQSIRLEDNYYYQQFSYDIESTTSASNYIDVAQTVHPSGMKMFTTLGLIQELEFIPIGETTFPFIRLDLNDVSTINDNNIKRITKPRTDSVSSSDIISNHLDKYLTDTATISSEDTYSLNTITYESELYFDEDYVRTEINLNIGV